MPKASLISIASYVPEKILTNDGNLNMKEIKQSIK